MASLLCLALWCEDIVEIGSISLIGEVASSGEIQCPRWREHFWKRLRFREFTYFEVGIQKELGKGLSRSTAMRR